VPESPAASPAEAEPRPHRSDSAVSDVGVAPSRLTLLVDHDNVPFSRITIRHIIESWIDDLSGILSPRQNIVAVVRAYGGWYDGVTASESRYRAAEFYQTDCPAAFLYAGRICRITFEFADRLLPCKTDSADHRVRITHTVASRSAAQMFGRRMDALACEEVDCELQAVRRWLTKRRACTRAACPQAFADQFHRKEQKQVDVHLAVDVITRAETMVDGEHLALASDDWDMLPALAATTGRLAPRVTVTAIRCSTTSTYLDHDLRQRGIRILAIDCR
jgi:hypothetical protein